MRIAYFISSHGFGHASRACAVMEAVWRHAPETRFVLFTATPAWFFELSLQQAVEVREVVTDLGLVQKNSLEEDLNETVRQLRDWIPFSEARVAPLAEAVAAAGCERVICDIAPIGVKVARRAGLPSLLIENFTWDWIYRAYTADRPEFARVADYLSDVFDSADQRIQTEPVCRPLAGVCRVPPISRMPRQSREIVRRQLGIPADARAVMITMGGIAWDYDGIEAALSTVQRSDDEQTWLIVPGGSSELRREGRAVLLPHRSSFFHPDLVQAADAVIGKLGYSTIAEVYQAGIPFGYVPRPTFPESPPVEAWVRRNMPHLRIDPEAFVAWQWLEQIAPLLAVERRPPGSPSDGTPDGGDAAAQLVLSRSATQGR